MVLRHEGKYVDDSRDLGEATNFGVSLRFYRRKVKADATVDDIKRLTVDDASRIYKEFFWDKYLFSEIDDQHIANRLFDLAVNCGPAHAIGMIQKAVNRLIGSHLVADGQLGPRTIEAINSKSIHPEALYDALIDEAKSYYEEISNFHENHRYLNGWLNRLAN